MTTTVRLILSGIAAVYLICIAAQFIGPYPALVINETFGNAVMLLLAVTVALHIAAAIALRTKDAVVVLIGSVALLAILFLIGLMKLTGDSL